MEESARVGRHGTNGYVASAPRYVRREVCGEETGSG